MFKHLLLFVIGFFVTMVVQAQPFTHPDRGFVSWKPAPRWEDALLSGNGTMGTLMFGEPHDETIIVNHALSYLPQRVPLQPIDQAARLTEIRDLLARGKFVEAARIPVEQSMKEGYGEKHWIDPYVPVCDIKLSMTPGNVADYIRMVDFETGETKVQWRQDGQLYQRSLFVSRADSVMVMKITSSGKVNVRLSLRQHPVNWDQWDYINNAIKYTNVSAKDNYLTYSTAFNHHFKGIPYGFEATALVYNVGGAIKTEGSDIVVTDADEVLVLMAVAPDFKNKASLQTYLQQWLTTIKPDYATLLEGQKRTHGELFGRVKLSLGIDAKADLQSEAFVETARQGVTPPMIQKEFDAARYNIISATGINPPNLQGIWSGTWTPPWSSGFTHDGNVEVAVSHLLSANTPELMASYLHYHERMMPWYRDNARRLFGTRGIVVPAHSSSHGWNIHFDETWTLSLWTAGAGWTAGILYDYYLYTGNIDMLEKHIYPFMREAAWFYEDFLIKGDDGKYLFSPSYSPENNPANSPSQLVVNATMDVMVAKDLLRNCIDAGKIVGETSQQIHKWEQMLTLMPDYRINNNGELAEWLPKNFEENHSHRHVSQLYALFDRMAPEFVRDTVLRNAAHKTLEARMAQRRRNNGGEMVFGLAQQGMVAANLGDAALTGEIIDLMAQYYWAPSFATYHNAGNLFNMDLSGGFPAVIIRSLVYSEPGSISLLPALSPNWETGAIEGIALRGQIIVNRLEWSRNDVVVRFTSAIDQRVMVKLPKVCSRIVASPKAAASKVDCSKNYFFLRMKKGVPVTVTLTY